MTKIEIIKNQGKTNGFIVAGHSGYAEVGSDIVCSAISSLSQMVCVGLENVLNLKPIIKIKEKDAYLSCFLPKEVEEEKRNQAQMLFDTFEQTVNLLLIGDKKLKKYINVEVKNEIY